MGQLDQLAGRTAFCRAKAGHIILFHAGAGCKVLSTILCAGAGAAILPPIFCADAECIVLFTMFCAVACRAILSTVFLPVTIPMQARIVRTRNLFFVGQLHLPGHIALAKAVLLLVICLCEGLGRCQRQEIRRARERCAMDAARRTCFRRVARIRYLRQRGWFRCFRTGSQCPLLGARALGSVVLHDPVWRRHPSARKLQSMRGAVGQQRADCAFYIQWGKSTMQMAKAEFERALVLDR